MNFYLTHNCVYYSEECEYSSVDCDYDILNIFQLFTFKMCLAIHCKQILQTISAKEIKGNGLPEWLSGKNLPAAQELQEMQVCPGSERPLEEGMVTLPSIPLDSPMDRGA